MGRCIAISSMRITIQQQKMQHLKDFKASILDRAFRGGVMREVCIPTEDRTNERSWRLKFRTAVSESWV